MKTTIHSLPNGYTVELIPNTETIIKEIWDNLFYERDYHIAEGDIVIDLGANQGIFSLFAAHRGAFVYAVEPGKLNYDLLCANIKRNKLSDRVTPFQCAVSKEDGFISLFIPEFEDLSSSGLITASLPLLNVLKEYKRPKIKKTKVKALTLKRFLNKINSPRISLLKIDTEGSELNILSGADSHDLEGVDRIVMETHKAYPEKSLYRRVQDMGFDVVTYDKIQRRDNDIFAVGYLYAVRASQKVKNSRKNPVAILNLPQTAAQGSEIIADASQSFSVINPDSGNLQYIFGIDGLQGEITPNPVITIENMEKGSHRVSLEVIDPKEKNRDEASDSDEKMIWLFSKDYFSRKNAFPLSVINQRYEFDVREKEDFVIPSPDISSFWHYSAIGIGISLSGFSKNPEPSGILFDFNGNATELKEIYQEMFFPGFPKESDICFSLESKSSFHVQLRWFAKENPKEVLPIQLDCDRSKKCSMGEKSIAHICRIKDEAALVVSLADLPKDWEPACIKICFSVHSSDSTGKSLEGKMIFRDRFFPLNDGYKEFGFTGNDIKSLMEFRVEVPQKRVYQVTWWPE